MSAFSESSGRQHPPMSAQLEGKAVLITGGARRVGAAIARRLHAAGADLIVHYRASAGDARALRDELSARRRGSVALIEADLLEPRALVTLVEDSVRAFGRLDALVNNASSFFATPLGQITEKAWDDLIGTNLKAPLFLAQWAAPELRRRRGAIVNIVDIHGEFPLAEHVVYSVAKGGLGALTRALARDLGPDVRVNGVAPGTVLWPEANVWRDAAVRERIIDATALKRMGEPEDIAKAVEFLLASAPYVTGQVIPVDGGRSIML
jgi:pteridine reductase